MGAGYTRQSAAEIASGETITDTGLENEFDALEAAFNSTSGHTHDGTTGEGPRIALSTSVSGFLQPGNGGSGGKWTTNATSAPDANDDSNDNYAVGSWVIDTSNDFAYQALDVSVGNAVWITYQEHSAVLESIAGLTPTGDDIAYFSSPSAAALTAFGAYGRGLVGVADEAAFKAYVNLEPGVDVQAYSAILQGTTASFTAADETKLDGIEALADVTDATNVAAAGAVMESDTTTALMQFVIDEDNMASNLDTKVPTQQSVKAYADTKLSGTEIVTLAPSANKNNNYATGMSTDANVPTVLAIAPTVSTVLTGFSATSMETGKRVVVNNSTLVSGATGRLIIFEKDSASSSAANRFSIPGRKVMPLTLMPGESAEFIYDGTNWKYLWSSRPMTLGGQFDDYFYGTKYFDAWTSGTGAAGSYAASTTDDDGDPVTYLSASTGTTTTGRAAHVSAPSSMRFGMGPAMSLSRIRIPTLSTVSEEFDVMVGFIELTSPSADGAYWLYDREISTDWQFRTVNNTTASSITLTGVTPVAAGSGSWPCLGVFVNADATRAEAWYSLDNGDTWTVHGTANTTNLPSSVRYFGWGTSITKSAGTTSRGLDTHFSGVTNFF